MPRPQLPIADADRPKIPGALKFYSICAWITGIMLLLLCLEMILKYVPWNGDYGYELYMGGNGPFLRLVTALPDNMATGINLSTGILIAHGWFYVVYLLSCFNLWSKMRWQLGRLVMMLIGGVVPMLSFFVEVRIAKEVSAKLAELSQERITTA